MKNVITKLMLAGLICMLTAGLFAQDDSPQRYYAFDYMKVKPGMHQDYLKLEAAWKKIHQANIKAGKYSFWAVTEVISPIGINCDYNYVIRMNFDGEEQVANHLENFKMPENLETILTAKELALVKRTAEIRDFVKSEIWMRRDQVLAEDMKGSNISVFNYFDFPDTGGRSAHFKVEQDYWKPVHNARVKDGQMRGWVLLGKRLPSGSAEPYFDATVDIYKDMNQYLSMSNPTPYLEKYHTGKNVEDIFKETQAAADLVRSEVRKKVMDSSE